MNYDLTEAQQEIAALAAQVAKQKLKPAREKYDTTGEFPWPVVEELRRADLFAAYLPESAGGLGAGMSALVLSVEALSRACGALAAPLASTGQAALAILLFGSAEQKKRWLPVFASGEKLGALAFADGEHPCVARKTAKGWTLDGRKARCVLGGEASVYVVLARTESGPAAFIVEKGAPGLSFGEPMAKMALMAATVRDLVFSGCELPDDALLYKDGMGLTVAQLSLEYARLAAAAQALGIAQGALDECTAYVRVRKQFKQTIASFQAIQHMLADAATQIEAARALLYATARTADKALELGDRDALRFGKESAMCKVLCSDTAMKAASDCVQMCGGIGFMRDFPVEKFMRDAKVTQLFDGPNMLHRNEIAALMLKEASLA